jgi:hypothetical protein
MTFSELQAAVASAIARSDVPAYAYTLATAELNTRLRLREMETTAELTADAASVALPDDFLMVKSLYVNADPQAPLEAATGYQRALDYRASGYPRTFTVVGSDLFLNPVPDGEYTLTLKYIARLAALSGDTDTNDVLTNHPALYLYAVLKHAAVWAQDVELASTYAAALEGEIGRVAKADMGARYPGPLRSRQA